METTQFNRWKYQMLFYNKLASKVSSILIEFSSAHHFFFGHMSSLVMYICGMQCSDNHSVS